MNLNSEIANAFDRQAEIATTHGATRLARHATRMATEARARGLMPRDFCKRCGAAGGLHYGACQGEPEPGIIPEKAGDKLFIRGTVHTDLYREGNPTCDHRFSAWETCGGVVERDGVTYAEFYFESNCQQPKCGARVGRQSETEVATVPRRCPYCLNPEPNHVQGRHQCIHHDCPGCGEHHNKSLACKDAVRLMSHTFEAVVPTKDEHGNVLSLKLVAIPKDRATASVPVLIRPTNGGYKVERGS